MISRDEIDKTSESLDVHTSHVQRDYVHGVFLWGLYNHSSLGKHLVLKGGNCLRKAYFPSSRYSGDLDFSIGHAIDAAELRDEINRVCVRVQEHCGVLFHTERTRIGDKRLAESRQSITDARIYFSDFYGIESSLVLSVRMDIAEYDCLHLPVQERQLIHPYSDSSSFGTMICKVGGVAGHQDEVSLAAPPPRRSI